MLAAERPAAAASCLVRLAVAALASCSFEVAFEVAAASFAAGRAFDRSEAAAVDSVAALAYLVAFALAGLAVVVRLAVVAEEPLSFVR